MQRGEILPEEDARCKGREMENREGNREYYSNNTVSEGKAKRTTSRRRHCDASDGRRLGGRRGAGRRGAGGSRCGEGDGHGDDDDATPRTPLTPRPPRPRPALPRARLAIEGPAPLRTLLRSSACACACCRSCASSRPLSVPPPSRGPCMVAARAAEPYGASVTPT